MIESRFAGAIDGMSRRLGRIPLTATSQTLPCRQSKIKYTGGYSFAKQLLINHVDMTRIILST